jgi:hypothetical protein
MIDFLFCDVYCLRGLPKTLADFRFFPIGGFLFFPFLADFRFFPFWRISCRTVRFGAFFFYSRLSFSDSVLVNTIVKNEPEDLTGRHRHNSDQAGPGITLNPIFVRKYKVCSKLWCLFAQMCFFSLFLLNALRPLFFANLKSCIFLRLANRYLVPVP